MLGVGIYSMLEELRILKLFLLLRACQIIKLNLLFLKSNLLLKTYTAGLFLEFFLCGPAEIG